MINVAIIGASGYTGAETARIILNHSHARIVSMTSRQYAGKRFDSLYPSFFGLTDIEFETYDLGHIAEVADVAFLALPHKLPMKIGPELAMNGLLVIDLSADFRFTDAERYEAAYEPHTAKGWLKTSVYGLSEVYFQEIAAAGEHRSHAPRIIGNPGCYPTSTLLPLIPLIRKGLIDPSTIVVDSKSGVSGAGRGLSETVHFCHVNDSFKAYKVASHRHSPEMEEILSREAGRDVAITFVPHLVPMTRGMQTTTYASLRTDVTRADIDAVYAEFYMGRPFVRLLPENCCPDSLRVRGSNFCDIGYVIDTRNKRIVLLSAIDNLVKGASGQAVQNMNIALGLDETDGLNTAPYPL